MLAVAEAVAEAAEVSGSESEVFSVLMVLNNVGPESEIARMF